MGAEPVATYMLEPVISLGKNKATNATQNKALGIVLYDENFLFLKKNYLNATSPPSRMVIFPLMQFV